MVALHDSIGDPTAGAVVAAEIDGGRLQPANLVVRQGETLRAGVGDDRDAADLDEHAIVYGDVVSAPDTNTVNVGLRRPESEPAEDDGVRGDIENVVRLRGEHELPPEPSIGRTISGRAPALQQPEADAPSLHQLRFGEVIECFQ